MTTSLDNLNSRAADEVTLNGDAAVDMKAELDDERRDVPEGWVRAFDRKSGHHFYAPSNASGKDDSTWTHPYDSSTYLASLPADHPASPRSSAAQALKQKAADEQATSTSGAPKEGGWLSKLGKAIGGEGPSAEEKRAIKDAEENFAKRMEALMSGDITVLGIKQKYAADPFAYPAPTASFDRKAASGVEYAYGYRGEYQRKYTRELGYDRIAKQAGGLSGYIDGVLQGAGVPVAGFNAKTGYGYTGEVKK
ncbi:uncharacterized protein MKK02DRAFT_43578 [Dioszegia hungarica]|uniref:WW domain-containing protein n=1 Tax=Dioszegia hungarica TaxID=4972 RepID=A0AA38HAI0_9TREE|nr:uncharacterized protein MKK02DRAFT_43578 [Dioszegia hungarica]KAI9637652.1 hypothetical protein MKK02DRAFT_43578 [Dioszegia hungarica]